MPAHSGGSASTSAAPPGAKLSRRKLWSFRLSAFALPFLLLLAAEGALRIAGFGYPTSFFLKTKQGGRDSDGAPAREVWIENQQFGWRFFPPAIARTPEPLVLPTAKASNTCRILVFGESAAMGDPEPDFGFPRVLKVLLEARYPGARFEVVNAAMTAINSHVIREIARDSLSLKGDVWILYMGNNEVVGPYGAGTVFTSQVPNLSLLRTASAVKATRLGQLFMRLIPDGKAGAEWAGMEMFLEQQIRADDPRMEAVCGSFQRNLEDIVHLGKAAGARVLVSTVVSNLKDCPPFASLHRRGLSEAERAEWEKLYQAGNQLLAKGQVDVALTRFQSAAQIDDTHAELQFRLGECLLTTGQAEAARTCFIAARDLDTLRFRPDTRINKIIRETAREREAVALLDAESVFERHSTNALVGDPFLLEHVHFTFEGNHLLARSVMDALTDLLPAWVRQAGDGSPTVLASDECARRLALTTWDRLQIAEEIRRRLRQPPFTNQAGFEARDQRWQETIRQLKAAASPAAMDAAVEIARQAVQRAPEDWILHRRLATLLEASSHREAALGQWREVLRLLPHGVEALYHVGNLADTLGRSVDVARYFREALRRKPDAVEVLNGLGLVLAAEGQTEEAIEQFERALRIRPAFVEARVNLGQTLAQAGRTDDARAQYELALRSDTNCAAAHINLGKLFSGAGHKEEAARHYGEALRIVPDNAVAQFNLGNALSDLGRKSDAIEHFAAAVAVEPGFVEARCNLAQLLAEAGRIPEARKHFEALVGLQPQSADAHFNLGVALAKERRLADAAVQFRETLRLEPDHGLARDYLEQVQKAQDLK